MARLSSRELALERRKALTTSGKKSSAAAGTGANRVRTVDDARPTRTNVAAVAEPASTPVVSAAVAPQRTTSFTAAPSRRTSQVKPHRDASRDLVLARREALSRRGKTADTSRDRNRADLARQTKAAPAPAPAETTKSCGCGGKRAAEKTALTSFSASAPKLSVRTERRASAPKRRAIENPSRALVLARRDAMAKHGKTAGKQSTSAAAVARQANPDLTSRELAQQVRELRTKAGARNKQSAGVTRPTGPNRHGAKQAAAADAHWKVGESTTTAGQTVTGTQANRSVKTTGNEASTCRSITGTEYLGAEVFQTFCQTAPAATTPAKVRVTATSHGNRVTGNEVGRSEKVTGDEPGTCKSVTGTEYISANQSAAYCGGGVSSPRKVGHSLTEQGRPVSGVMVGRSASVTGDEAGASRSLTGDQYLGSDPLPEGRPAAKVGLSGTLSGTGVTGTLVGRSSQVTGNEFGSCHRVTGDQYISAEQVNAFCGGKPEPEAAKVGFSVTNRNQVVSGTRTGRSEHVTGDEPGSCQAVTGTPYAGLEQAGQNCGTPAVQAIRERTPVRPGTPSAAMTGIQPGVGGVMTGDKRGACEAVTGTPYVGADQLAAACGADAPAGTDTHGQSPEGAAWTRFSVVSPARAAQQQRDARSGVTGTSYEEGNRITGPFDMAGGKVTGTEQFRFDNREFQNRQQQRQFQPTVAVVSEPTDKPASRVTGEGSSTKITGDDWDRGEHVTGTEGASARRRNPSRPGPMSAMSSFERKRNEETEWPVSRVTGSSGNTEKGSLITVSGGARG
ncbi:carboxysome shell protein [Synechococcus sp. HB1133]|uniref:carboxysome assembly protein CsoS2 n=1 Tax=unclassified Synechococcus TaxID=2626047 RepID=UPI0014077A52|nr:MULTISPECIES: CsoS2 family carboxysome shell protein [unclassified Synechococcus]MCB4393555.1 carboxysome shell protein [Synechococcus sp. PH41509]MCB4422268.1 carboxysome shell protein [Synechococcus sp. HB1133]MCB4429787.1 carboxysome shell protein [Synechococcus sp. HBA1120]NHI81211.1 carboxysome shell protein [Synechococcus sp. HB1133]